MLVFAQYVCEAQNYLCTNATVLLMSSDLIKVNLIGSANSVMLLAIQHFVVAITKQLKMLQS